MPERKICIMSNLVIVESPSKISTIKGYLGSNYKVVASVGHIRDLPKSSLGVDIEDHFTPHYINIRGKGELIKELKKYAKNAGKVYLATDPDREGEAISWHLASVLELPKEKTFRVTFNEITKPAVTAGIKNPRSIDMNLVNSQQARRILDRIVGYKLSPFLWKNVKSGLSAGRVQTVAAKMVVDRENQIREFVPVEYWTLDALLENSDKVSFKSRFYGTENDKVEIKTKEEADKILSEIEGNSFIVKSVVRSVKKKNPPPPFNTSSLQQDASRKLRFSPTKTMKVAQELYEGIALGAENGGTHGLITYMRTDSLRVSAEASALAKDIIIGEYGKEYYPSTPRTYKTKAGAQDAHEAIRPANSALTPEKIKSHLSPDQYKLYKLIWERFIASQMASAAFDTVSADIACGKYIFKSTGSTLKFKGYLALYDDSAEGDENKADSKIPPLTEGSVLKLLKLLPEQHFTDPPPRFNEATLIKFLEDKGIGRPSTIAPTIALIISRGYVKKDGKNLAPTPLGEAVVNIIASNFREIVDYKFTAQMESDLDEIASCKTTMEETLDKFYSKFSVSLEKANSGMKNNPLALPPEETDMICEKCGSRMIVKSGRYGKFAACPNYPTCKNTKPLKSEENEEKAPEKVEGLICEKCGAPLVKKVGKFGPFYSCSNYPQCKFTYKPKNKIGVPCPICSSELLCKTKGKTVFYSCEKFPECTFSSWDRPTLHLCPKCGSMLFYKRSKNLLVCKSQGCDYTRESEDNYSGDLTPTATSK